MPTFLWSNLFSPVKCRNPTFGGYAEHYGGRSTAGRDGYFTIYRDPEEKMGQIRFGDPARSPKGLPADLSSRPQIPLHANRMNPPDVIDHRTYAMVPTCLRCTKCDQSALRKVGNSRYLMLNSAHTSLSRLFSSG